MPEGVLVYPHLLKKYNKNTHKHRINYTWKIVTSTAAVMALPRSLIRRLVWKYLVLEVDDQPIRQPIRQSSNTLANQLKQLTFNNIQS